MGFLPLKAREGPIQLARLVHPHRSRRNRHLLAMSPDPGGPFVTLTKGLGASSTARQTGLDRKAVRKYLARRLEVPVNEPRDPEECLAKEYRTYLVDRLSSLAKALRPAAPRRFERRFETPAGQQDQLDFA